MDLNEFCFVFLLLVKTNSAFKIWPVIGIVLTVFILTHIDNFDVSYIRLSEMPF